MGLQVLRVKGSKVAKKVANKQFKLLCADYNKVYKIIDTLKEMLDSGDYKKGTIDEIPTAIQAIQTVMSHSMMISEDLQKTVDELTERLRAADEYKKEHEIYLITTIRLEYMTNLVIYLREMKIEVDKIVDEIGTIIDRISNIEEFEELKFSYTSFRNIPFFAYTAVSITTIDGEISFLSENDTITEAKLGIVAFVVIIGIIVSVIIAWCAVLVWLRRTPKKKEMNSFVLSNKTNN